MDIVLGLILLVFGGDLLVRGSVVVARKFGVSELMIGLTLVGFGTSTPELVTSIEAALAGSPGIAIGNVVGSNIANILLILGVAALIWPITAQKDAMRRDGVALVAATVSCIGLAFYGTLTAPWGAAFILLLLGYTAYCYRKERCSHDASAEMHRAESHIAEPAPGNIWLALAMALGGIALTIGGARFLVEGSIALAREFGISETVIGLTLVAVGTSLPELATAVMAAIRKKSDLALGNVVGSNIYNIWFILGCTALVHPIPIPESILTVDIWVMLAATFLLLIAARTGYRISRPEGAVFLALYTAYILVLIPQQ